MVLNSFFNAIFGFIVDKSPVGTVLIVSFILTLIVTLVYKLTTNQTLLKALKEEMKTLRADMKLYKNDHSKLMELQKKSMEKSMEQMKHTIKPMIITFIPLIFIFGWLRDTYPAEQIILKFPFNLPKMGSSLGFGWLGIYVLSSVIFSIILRKILKVH